MSISYIYIIRCMLIIKFPIDNIILYSKKNAKRTINKDFSRELINSWKKTWKGFKTDKSNYRKPSYKKPQDFLKDIIRKYNLSEIKCRILFNIGSVRFANLKSKYLIISYTNHL